LQVTKRLLGHTADTHERRRTLKVAYRAFSNYVARLCSNPIEQNDTLEILDLMQDLKQPSLEDGAQSFQRPKPFTTSDSDDFLLPENNVLLEDSLNGTGEEWRRSVLEKLDRENSISLDFFVSPSVMYCLLVESENRKLSCRFINLIDSPNRDLRGTINRFRYRMRRSIELLGNLPTSAEVHVAASHIEDELEASGHLLGPLEEILGHRRVSVVYVSPMLGLHGIPLHAIRTRSGWSLSEVGPVLQISKTRHLIQSPQSQMLRGTTRILCSSDKELQAAGRSLGAALGVEVITPLTQKELVSHLREASTVIVLGHGWFDKDHPTRSRTSLGHGLRLTLNDIQEMGLEGTEVIMMSCWAGWGVRGALPIGEIHSGPTCWMLAGAGAVVAPLWPVPVGAATKFIEDYITGRREGLTRANALEKARRQSDTYEFGGICRSAFVLWGTDGK